MTTAKLQVERRRVRILRGAWRRRGAGYQSGNVRVEPQPADSVEPDERPEWFIKIRHAGRWRWAFSSARPWGYITAGAAMGGLAKWKSVHFWPGKP